MGEPRRLTGQEGGAGSNTRDEENPVGMSRDRDNPAGTQGTRHDPSDKAGPVLPRERHRARGPWLVILVGTWFPESGEVKRWLCRLRPVPRCVRRMACPQRTGVPRWHTAAVRPRTRQ